MLKSVYAIVTDQVYADFYEKCRVLGMDSRVQFAKLIEEFAHTQSARPTSMHAKGNGAEYPRQTRSAKKEGEHGQISHK